MYSWICTLGARTISAAVRRTGMTTLQLAATIVIVSTVFAIAGRDATPLTVAGVVGLAWILYLVAERYRPRSQP